MVINIYSSDDAFIAAYRLLGLSEREAVAAANSRAQKAIQACADYAQSVYVAKDLTIKELEAKNAALVAALEAIKQEHGYRYTYGDGFGNVVEKRINSVGVAVDKALAANEKGGAND